MGGFNFTERVRKVLAMARDEADRYHHEYVGTEHILLALMRESEGTGASVLRNLGGNFMQIRQTIEEILKPGKDRTAVGLDLPYTSRAKKVLELAMHEARDLKNDYVGTEHVLLGLLREEKGIAAQVLTHYGIALLATRAEVLRMLSSDAQPERNGATSPAAAVTVEIRYADGMVRARTFKTVAEAIEFLRQ